MSHQHDHVHAGLHQQVQPVLVIFVGPNSSTTKQLLLGIFRSQRVVPVLLEIGAGNYSHQFVIFINNWQLALKQRERTLLQISAGDKTSAWNSAADQEHQAGSRWYKGKTHKVRYQILLDHKRQKPWLGKQSKQFAGLEKDSVFSH